MNKRHIYYSLFLVLSLSADGIKNDHPKKGVISSGIISYSSPSKLIDINREMKIQTNFNSVRVIPEAVSASKKNSQ